MYDIRQFRPALFVLLMVGMSGFALALQSPGLWVLGFGGALANALLVAAGRFRPLPRFLANIVTIGAMLWTVRELRVGTDSPVVTIGRFLVMLQLVKLWEQRANRDYGQLLVLSLLLMVAASINTASLGFGIILVVYLFLALYVCLLFHLKVETDAAKAALALPEERVSPAALKQDQRYLSRSMRRLTFAVSSAAIVLAVLVFLFFPRGTGANLLSPPQFRGAQALVGFSDDINLTSVSSIQNNTAIVAYAKVWHDEQPVGAGNSVLLRGLTHDSYVSGRWTRYGTRPYARYPDADRETPAVFTAAPARPWRARIKLEPVGTKALFTLEGAQSVTPMRSLRLLYGGDGAVTMEDSVQQPLEYEVVASGNVSALPRPNPPRIYHVAAPIAEYAMRPDVSGTVAADAGGGGGGSLARQRRDQYRAAMRPAEAAKALAEEAHQEAQRAYAATPQPAQRAALRAAEAAKETAEAAYQQALRQHAAMPQDAQVAANIEQHLRGADFSYTLDLTDARNRSGKDPYVWFLSDDGKRGHCEYFAGAMALMCQSLGMQARVVTGFRTDEYNNVAGDYFIVRQAHAHAWVEVLTAEGWRSYDPTSGRAVGEGAGASGLWQKVKHFFNFLEYSYASSVIAYDNDARENLIESVEQGMSRPFYKLVNAGGIEGLLDSPVMEALTDTLVASGIVLVCLTAAAMLGWTLWKRVRLRRRAARIGIASLPPDEQLRLAKQLGFYDDLLQLLRRHEIVRPPHQTPLEFSRSLMFLPADVYGDVRRLTGVFYRVRYGKSELTAGNRGRLANVIRRMEAALQQQMATSASLTAPARA